MATPFTHAYSGIIFGKIYTTQKMPWKFWILSMACPALADLDAIGFHCGIPYDHFMGHRGFTHSIIFSIVVGFIIALLFFTEDKKNPKKWWSLVAYFSLITASHGVLDALTNGGLGIAFFSPFDNGRYFFPWQPVQVAPLSILAFFSEWGVEVMISEIVWLWAPLTLIMIVIHGCRKLKPQD